ncbi:hypothetical protein DFH09DRAFT_1280991, partial [Mycena vulgaris]
MIAFLLNLTVKSNIAKQSFLVLVTTFNEGIVKTDQPIFLEELSRLATSQMALSLAMNFTATLLLASRIWYITRDEVLRRVITITVESASLTGVAQIIHIAFYQAQFPGIYFISDTTVQILALAPLIMIILTSVSIPGFLLNSDGTNHMKE